MSANPTNELCQHQDICVREFYLPDLDTENPHHHRDVRKCEAPHPTTLNILITNEIKYPGHKCESRMLALVIELYVPNSSSTHRCFKMRTTPSNQPLTLKSKTGLIVQSKANP